MSDFGGIPTDVRKIAELDRRVEDLERRAASLAGPPPTVDCCGRYCCLDTTGYVITTGTIQTTCTFDPDPVGGMGMRLSYHGWARVKATAAGSFAMVWWAEVDGTKYDGAPREDHSSVADGDSFTIPLGGTIDVGVTDPTLTIRVQNLSTVTLDVLQVYTELTVLPIAGDSSCGHPHTGTGPL